MIWSSANRDTRTFCTVWPARNRSSSRSHNYRPPRGFSSIQTSDAATGWWADNPTPPWRDTVFTFPTWANRFPLAPLRPPTTATGTVFILIQNCRRHCNCRTVAAAELWSIPSSSSRRSRRRKARGPFTLIRTLEPHPLPGRKFQIIWMLKSLDFFLPPTIFKAVYTVNAYSICTDSGCFNFFLKLG